MLAREGKCSERPSHLQSCLDACDRWRTIYKTGGEQRTRWTRCCSDFGRPHSRPLTPYNISLVSWFFLRLPPRLEALFQWCKTSTYVSPLHLCGHVECLPCPPYGFPACIGDPEFINVKLCGHPACIGDPEFINVKLCGHPACIGGLACIRGWKYGT